MEGNEELQRIAKKLRNEKAKEWRRKNRERMKEINEKYWLKKAKEFIEKENSEGGE